MSAPSKRLESSAPAAANKDAQRGLDFAAGVPLTRLPQNAPVAGFVGEQDVVAVRQGSEVFVVGAKCSHYGAPLVKGRVDGERLMCPWHHACFSLRDGATLKAPGLAPLPSFDVAIKDGQVRATTKRPAARRSGVKVAPKQVTIVGAGAAAFSVVAELRQQGYDGPIAVFGNEPDAPYDRTKLSKAYLAGAVPADKLALDAVFLSAQSGSHTQAVQWSFDKEVVGLDVAQHKLALQGGGSHTYDALVLATGAVAKWPGIAGEKLPHVHRLRQLKDAKALLAVTEHATRVCIVGASFIGLEAASVLRQRGLEVHVIGRDKAPMQQVLGKDVGQVLFHLHTSKGVHFHAGVKVEAITPAHVQLSDASRLAADVVLLATGVTPDVKLAKAAGLICDDGICVDAQLQTSTPGIYAAGDVARFIYHVDQKPVRIEHWSMAEQMGRVAARNVIGQKEAFATVPFFWTEHYGMKVRYVGHTRKLSHNETFGDLEKGRAAVALYDGEQLSAVLTVGCDDVSMACEAALSRSEPHKVRGLLQAL